MSKIITAAQSVAYLNNLSREVFISDVLTHGKLLSVEFINIRTNEKHQYDLAHDPSVTAVMASRYL